VTMARCEERRVRAERENMGGTRGDLGLLEEEAVDDVEEGGRAVILRKKGRSVDWRRVTQKLRHSTPDPLSPPSLLFTFFPAQVVADPRGRWEARRKGPHTDFKLPETSVLLLHLQLHLALRRLCSSFRLERRHPLPKG
jgi:hypothetical protein